MIKTVAADLETWADISQIVGTVGIFAAIAGVALARKQLRASVKATGLQTLLALDDAFSRYRELRDRIRWVRGWEPNTDAEWVEVRRYLSVLDRVGVALRTGLIDRTAVDTYRTSVQYLADNVKLNKYVRENSQTWPDLIYLWKELEIGSKD